MQGGKSDIMSIDILMAVYNGEKYIGEQIESILAQTVGGWRLLICDDCSQDSTVEIIKKYRFKNKDRIFLYENEKNSGSPKSNFFKLLKMSEADYVFTCDQDDIWKSDKIEKTLKAFDDDSIPTLVHTDLTVVDKNKKIIHSSMIRSQHINVKRDRLNELIVQNIVTGCTMAINKSLADILKEPDVIPVHDWWIAATAAIYGQIKYINEATVYYRQHGDNQCGAQDMYSAEYLAGRLKDKNRSKHMLELSYIMAEELMDKYRIPTEYMPMLREYSAMLNKGKLKKVKTLFKYSIWKSGIIRKLGQLYFL